MSPGTQENDFGGTTEEKVARLVYYATRQGMTLSQHQETITEMQLRLRAIEDENSKRAVHEARAEEQQKAVAKELGDLTKSVDTMKSSVNWAVRIVAGAVLLAIARWMLAGNLGPPL